MLQLMAHGWQHKLWACQLPYGKPCVNCTLELGVSVKRWLDYLSLPMGVARQDNESTQNHTQGTSQPSGRWGKGEQEPHNSLLGSHARKTGLCATQRDAEQKVSDPCMPRAHRALEAPAMCGMLQACPDFRLWTAREIWGGCGPCARARAPCA